METWRIRDEIKRLINQWYFILAFLVVGGAVGFLSSYILLTPYRAVADLYIGIDISRVNEMEYLIPLAETEPLNLDDYKNWQLKQAADLISSSPVVTETISSLRNMSPVWQEISQEEFRESLDIYWYTTGTWRLQVTNPNQDMAKAAAARWLEVSHQYLKDRLADGERAAVLDAQLQSYNTAVGMVTEDLAAAETFLTAGREWKTRLAELSADQQLSDDLRQDLSQWLGVYRKAPSSWQPDFNQLPPQGGTIGVYQDWLEIQIDQAETAREEYHQQIDILEEDRQDVLELYHQALEDSLGLSANLVLRPNTSGIKVEKLRSPGMLTLGGGFLGFLALLLFTFFRIRERESDDR